MAAIIGLDDARLPELVAPAVGPRRVRRRQPQLARARSWSPASGRRSRRRSRSPRSWREARHRAAGVGRRPLAADGGGRRGACATSSRASPSRTPHPPLLANADARADHDRRGLPRGAGGAPHHRRRLGRRRRGDDARPASPPSSRSGRAACSPASSSASPPMPCASRSTTRRPATASPSRSPRRPSTRRLPPPSRPRKERRASTRLLPPRRRHRPRRRQPRRQRQGHRLGQPRQRRVRPAARSPSSTRRRYSAQVGRRGPGLRRRRSGWTPRPSAAASRAMWYGVAAAKQAVADAGPRDHGRQPRGHRRRLRHRRRRPDADDRELGGPQARRAPTASRRRSSPTASSTRRRG